MPSVDDNVELVFRYAVRSASGPRRDINQDAGHASERLLAVADGTGGWEAGQAASSAAVDAIRQLDTQISNEEVLDTLDRAIRAAHESLRDMANRDPALKSMGTTLTAIVLAGPQLGLVHIGDTRAYVLRDDEFLQLTRDHTLLQVMLDIGKITKDFLVSHPQIRRSPLLRLLTTRDDDYDSDLQLRGVHAGDRYLLCSDGLHEATGDDAIAGVLRAKTVPDEAARDLVALARANGGTDDVTCIVADVVPRQAPPE